MNRRKQILLLGIGAGLIFAFVLILNTFFGPQTHEAQGAELRATAEQRLKAGDVDGALANLKIALKINPHDEEARRRYDEIVRERR